jgi:hypothetical protein
LFIDPTYLSACNTGVTPFEENATWKRSLTIAGFQKKRLDTALVETNRLTKDLAGPDGSLDMNQVQANGPTADSQLQEPVSPTIQLWDSPRQEMGKQQLGLKAASKSISGAIFPFWGKLSLPVPADNMKGRR